MTYLVAMLLMAMIIGVVAVAANTAPYFAAFGVVVAAGVGCGVLIGHGGTFMSLVLFLIYLGGMLVVFAYAAAMAAEPFPEAWGDRPVVGYVVVYLVGVCLVVGLFWEGWYEGSWVTIDSMKEFRMLRGDTSGVAVMYTIGGGLVIISAWVLLVTMFVVVELTRGLERGALRAV
uniref:NADH-ubiquinone oxidoreductase chain 6 n=1 Tax=Barbatula toni TaxID=357282 RepID=A0A7D7KM84_BARTO|nr:NADH dehydrogenase subunit 6 [Barbatula toni]